MTRDRLRRVNRGVDGLRFTGKSDPVRQHDATLQAALYNTTHWCACVCRFLTRADLLLWKEDRIPIGEVIYRTETLSEKGLHCSTKTERMRGAAERPKWIFWNPAMAEDGLCRPLRINTDIYTQYTLQSGFFSALEWRYKCCIASNHILIHERAGSVQSLASLTFCRATSKDWFNVVSWSHPSFRSHVEMWETGANNECINQRRRKYQLLLLQMNPSIHCLCCCATGPHTETNNNKQPGSLLCSYMQQLDSPGF